MLFGSKALIGIKFQKAAFTVPERPDGNTIFK
jgi:hypothetical protein